jgi:S-adenosylmethionine hydrolase
VAWIDRFGNVQLRLHPHVLDDAGLLVGDRAWVLAADRPGPVGSERAGGSTGGSAAAVAVRRVGSFGELGTGEMGLMVDANGRMALVRNQASAAHRLALSGPGHRVRIWWQGTEGPRR